MKRKISPNIKLWGFMDINSDELTAIIDRCNFLIYPSGSEGGCPGAVINSMKKGLIPIVTPWAAFDGIEEYGFFDGYLEYRCDIYGSCMESYFGSCKDRRDEL